MNEQPQIQLSRRGLLGGSAAALSMAAVSAFGGEKSHGGKAGRRLPGIQLYTLRASMEKDLPGTLKAVAGMRYREVEFAGYFDTAPAEIRQLLDGLGLKAPSSHIGPLMLQDDPGPVLEAAYAIGHDYLTVAWLAEEDRETVDQYRTWAEVFNRVGEICREHGLRFAYHNHDFEFQSIGGVVPFDILLAETDPALVDFELDFFWVTRASLDVAEVLARAPERFTMAHIKDMDSNGEMTDVGSGEIDFSSILANPAASGLRHLFVEHDQPEHPFKSAAISRLGMRSLLGGKT